MDGKAHCPECGAIFNPGASHCRGGAYGGCCLTFSSDSAFTAHREGPVEARRCLEVAASGLWRLSSRGWTDSTPMDSEVLKLAADWSE